MGRKKVAEGAPEEAGDDSDDDAPAPTMPGMMGGMPGMMGGMPGMMGGMPGMQMGMPGMMGGMPGMPMGMPQMGGMPMGGMPMGGMPMGGMPMGGMPGGMPMGGMPGGMPMGGMPGMMMGGMNPMMAMMMSNMAAMGAASTEKEEVAAAPEPSEPMDSRVREICRHFNIEQKICEKLNKAMKMREDYDEDMQVLWYIMERGAKLNKRPVDVMLVKIRELTNGTYVGKDLLDPEIREFDEKYNLDDQLLLRLTRTMRKRGKHKSQDLKDMAERIGTAKQALGILKRMLEGLEEKGRLPPAPGWLVQAQGGPKPDRPDADDRRKSRSRSRDRDRRR